MNTPRTCVKYELLIMDQLQFSNSPLEQLYTVYVFEEVDIVPY